MYHKVSGFYHDTQKRKITSFKQISYRYQNLNMKLQFSREYEQKKSDCIPKGDWFLVRNCRPNSRWMRKRLEKTASRPKRGETIPIRRRNESEKSLALGRDSVTRSRFRAIENVIDRDRGRFGTVPVSKRRRCRCLGSKGRDLGKIRKGQTKPYTR